MLKDSANKKPMRVHQAFIRLASTLVTNTYNDNEITFVAEPDNANVYKFDMVRFSIDKTFIIVYHYYFNNFDVVRRFILSIIF